MLKRVKENKGYYALLVLDTIYGAASVAMTLALLNLPVAIIATALNVGANVIGGIVTGPRAHKQADATSEDETATDTPKEAVPKGPKAFVKSSLSFIKNCFKDADFVVGSSAAGAGTNIFFQAAVGITFFIAAAPAIAPIAGLAGCAALAGLGIFGLIAGNIEKWKGLGKFYRNAFHKGEPEETTDRGNSFFKRLTSGPRLQKFIKSPITQTIKKLALIGMSVESNLFTVIAAGAIIAAHVAAIAAAPVLLPAMAVAAIPILIAVKWGAWPAWNMISAARLVVGGLFKGSRKVKEAAKAKKAAKDSTDNTPAPEEVPAPVVATAPVNGGKPVETLTGQFEKTSGKLAGNDNEADKNKTGVTSSIPAAKSRNGAPRA